jgi:hypothetical protein
MIDEKILVQTEEQSLLRDVHSKALLNKDMGLLQKYKAQKNYLSKIKQEEIETKEKITNLENELHEIKNLLIQLIKKEN